MFYLSRLMVFTQAKELRYRICYTIIFVACFCCVAGAQALTGAKNPQQTAIYDVIRLKGSIRIDGNWDKPQWKRTKALVIDQYMGPIPSFKPQTEVKMAYDEENVYVIFRVKDKYTRSLVQEYNGNVSGDACVEFFFAPDAALPLHYFNLEVNAGGTPLLFYVTKPWTGFSKLDAQDISQIEIAHSLPSVVDPEITEPVTWTIEYRVPVALLQKFSKVTNPRPGVAWKANFYKTASQSTNPHWITWAHVDNPRPDFHLPQFFGTLKFR